MTIEKQNKKRGESSGLILATGVPSEKVLEGRRAIYTPSLVLCDREIIGIRLTDQAGNGPMWGMAPIKIITSYRALRIAELVTEFGSETMYGCFYAAQTENLDCEMGYVNEIERQIGKSARSKILESVPQDIEAIMKSIMRAGAKINGSELNEVSEFHPEILTPSVRDFLAIFNNELRLQRQEE